jgi:hypothetical protein
MLVSLNKNPWLWTWISEKVDGDSVYRDYLVSAFSRTRPEEIKKQIIMKLTTFGYKVKFTSGNDAIISMSEEEYVFLKLKYS